MAYSISKDEAKQIYAHMTKTRQFVGSFGAFIDQAYKEGISVMGVDPTISKLSTLNGGHSHTVSLGMAVNIPNPKQEEKIMYNMTPEQTAREHLRDRLRSVKWERRADLQKAYGLVGDDRPTTPKELAERLAAGKFVVRGATDERQDTFYSISSVIEWRDPKVTKDQAGFDAAWEKVTKAYTEAKDVIIVKTPDEGLKALQTFEKAKFA